LGGGGGKRDGVPSRQKRGGGERSKHFSLLGEKGERRNCLRLKKEREGSCSERRRKREEILAKNPLSAPQEERGGTTAEEREEEKRLAHSNTSTGSPPERTEGSWLKCYSGSSFGPPRNCQERQTTGKKVANFINAWGRKGLRAE